MNFQDRKPEKEKAKEPATPPENKLKTWFPNLSADVHAKLAIYHDELIKFNKAINLISASTVSKVESVHFADSILAAQLIYPVLHPGKEVYDFGSGNGFPGLVMAVMYPQVQFVLVERDGRKSEFLKHAASKMALSNLKVLTKSIEELPDGSCLNVVTRGFAALHKCMLITRKTVGKSGKLFHLKGDSFASELASVPSQLFSHWNASLIGNYTIPDTNSVETVVLTEKMTD